MNTIIASIAFFFGLQNLFFKDFLDFFFLFYDRDFSLFDLLNSGFFFSLSFFNSCFSLNKSLFNFFLDSFLLLNSFLDNFTLFFFVLDLKLFTLSGNFFKLFLNSLLVRSGLFYRLLNNLKHWPCSPLSLNNSINNFEFLLDIFLWTTIEVYTTTTFLTIFIHFLNFLLSNSCGFCSFLCFFDQFKSFLGSSCFGFNGFSD